MRRGAVVWGAGPVRGSEAGVDNQFNLATLRWPLPQRKSKRAFWVTGRHVTALWGALRSDAVLRTGERKRRRCSSGYARPWRV